MRYSADLRERILVAAGELRHQGKGWREAGEALGVPWQTLMRWSTSGHGAAPRMRRVQVGESPATSLLRLTTPAGLQIDGLSLDAVIQLVRAFG